MTQPCPSMDRHDWHSEQYVAEWVKRYTAQEDAARQPHFKLMADLIAVSKEAPLRILDVGAGYGALSKALLERFPRVHVTVQDYSEPMLERARSFLKDFGRRTSYIESDLITQEWAAHAGGPFDAVVSSMAIHHLQDGPRIASLYREIREVLKPGGCFLNLELVSGPTLELQQVYDQAGAARRAQGNHAGHPAVMGSRLPKVAVHVQLSWLMAAGFRQADCFWKELGLALVGGFK